MILTLPPFIVTKDPHEDMIDTSNPLRVEPEIPAPIAPPFAPLIPTISNGYSPPLDGVEEEDDSTIKCVCGNDDDDGNTVFCELCKTWQHIACYYLSNKDVPDIHECVNCNPRQHAGNAMIERHLQPGTLAPPERKPRRISSKLPKKRTKDSLPPNGVRSTSAQDRGSGSPRDQPPPAKRPKTNHKSSSSTSAPHAHSLQRKRAGSTAASGRNSLKRQSSPPIYRGDFFSPQFMHRNINYTPTEGNLHLSTAVLNECDQWLHHPDKLSQITDKSSGSIFQRWDQPIEDLEKLSPEVHHEHSVDTLLIHGQHPTHHILTVHTDVDKDAFIGELRGQIGLKHDYIRDPANRWQELHHPEPFVFMHETLPVYVDCRTEGTEMRFVRRSCEPNVKIQIIVKGTAYHYCLVSIRPIAAHEEVTLNWQMPEKAMRIMNSMMNHLDLERGDEDFMINWTSGLLSNFGGCACTKPLGTCPWSRFDRRVDPRHPAPPPTLLSEKSVKIKKPRKSGAHVSPLSTGHAVNSRAASEAINGELDDIDDVDTGSASGSSRSKAPSRDGTPAIGLGVELSAREQRKIQEQERLIRKMEEEEQTGGRKKKRNSAVSALNTPSVNTSNQLGFSNSNNPSPISTHAEMRGLTNGTNGVQKEGASLAPRPLRRTVRPVYVDASMQTDPEPEPPEPFEVTIRRQFPNWKPKGPHHRRLDRLRKIQEWGRQALAYREAAAQALAPISPVSDTSKDEGFSTINGVASKGKSKDMPPPPLPASSRRSASPAKAASTSSKAETTEDVEMADADDTKQQATPTSSQEDASAPPEAPVVAQVPFDASVQTQVLDATMVDPALIDPALNSTSTQTEARASPASVANGATLAAPAPIVPAKRKSPSPSLHVTLPGPPTFPSSTTLMTPSTPSALGGITPTSVNPLTSPAIAQSPNGPWPSNPLASPSLITTDLTAPSNGFITQPSPMKKKMSLSDYLKRKKSERQVPGSSLSAVTPGSELPMEQSMELGESKSSPAPEGEGEALSVVTAEPEGLDEVKEEGKEVEIVGADATALPIADGPLTLAPTEPQLDTIAVAPEVGSEPNVPDAQLLDAELDNNAESSDIVELPLQPMAPMAQMMGQSVVSTSDSIANSIPNSSSIIDPSASTSTATIERRDSKSELPGAGEATSLTIDDSIENTLAPASVLPDNEPAVPSTSVVETEISPLVAGIAPMAPMMGGAAVNDTEAQALAGESISAPTPTTAPVAPM